MVTYTPFLRWTILILSFTKVIHCGKIPNIVSTDTTLVRDDNPHYLQGDVTIETGVTLTIENGVYIDWKHTYKMYVNGAIDACDPTADTAPYHTRGPTWLNPITINVTASYNKGSLIFNSGAAP
eukprot:224577_1